MKVERISDTQVRVTLYSSDLSDRNINLAELAYRTDKTIGLFREMMEQAVTECGFKFNDAPLMIEATPLSIDSLMLVISAIDEKNLNQASGMSFIKDIIKIKDLAKKNYDGAKMKLNKTPPETALVFSFGSIDEAAFAASRLVSLFSGSSSLIKKDGSYYLVIENDQQDNKPPIKRLESVLSEYGRKNNGNALYISHLKEHGDMIIKESAVNKLSDYLSK